MNYWANLFFSRKFILSLLAVLILVLVFRIWIYDGYLHVQGVAAPYEIDLSNYAHYKCDEGDCVFAVPPGEYAMRINKDGYFEESENITIKFQKQYFYQADLQKIPDLEAVSEIPVIFQEKLTPLSSFSIDNSFVVDDKGNVYTLEKDSGKLLFLGVDGERDLLAELEPVSEAELVVGGDYLFVLTNGELYEVDIINKRKYRLLPEEYIYEIKFDQGFLFADVGGKVLMRENQDEFKELPYEVFVDQICVFANKIFFAENNTFYWVDKGDLTNSKQIIEFTVNKNLEKIACESANNLLLLFDDQQVFRLNF